MLYNSLPTVAYNIQDNYNIVLIDDFIGTGDTICRKVNFLLKKCHLMGIILCMGIYKYPRLGRGQQEKGKDYV